MSVFDGTPATERQKGIAFKAFFSTALLQATLIAVTYGVLWWMDGIDLIKGLISSHVGQAFLVIAIPSLLSAIYLRRFAKLENPIINEMAVGFMINISIGSFLAVAYVHGMVTGIFGAPVAV